MSHVVEHKGQLYYPVVRELFEKNAHDLVPYVKVSQIFHPQSREDLIYLIEEDYIQYSQRLMKEHHEDKTNVLSLAMGVETALVLLKKQGLNEEIFELFNDVSKNFLNISFDDSFKTQFGTLLCSPRAKEYLLKTVLCKAVAKKMGWKSGPFLHKLFLATLFCDLGEEIKNPNNVFHAELSVKELRKTKKVTEDVLQAILHHHEYNDTSGPLKVSRYYIHPLAKVIRVVEECLKALPLKDMHFSLRLQSLCPQKVDTQIVQACLELFQPKK